MASVAEAPKVENLDSPTKEKNKRPRPKKDTIGIFFATLDEAKAKPPTLEDVDGGGTPKDMDIAIVKNGANGQACYVWCRNLNDAIAYVASTTYSALWLEGGKRGRAKTKIDPTTMMLLKLAFGSKDKAMMTQAEFILKENPQYRTELVSAGLVK